MPRHVHWLAQDDAQGLAEYALILALASLGIVLALLVLGNSLGAPVRGSSDQLDALTAQAPAGADPDPGEPAGAGAKPSGGESGGSRYGRSEHGEHRVRGDGPDGSSGERHREKGRP